MKLAGTSRDVRWFQSELTDLDLLRQGSCQSRHVQAESHPPVVRAEQVCLQVVKGFPWMYLLPEPFRLTDEPRRREAEGNRTYDESH